MDEDCFVSPVVIFVKSDKSVNIASDSRNLSNSYIKIRPHMPNVEEISNQCSVDITRDRTMQSFISKIDMTTHITKEIIPRDKPTLRIRNHRKKI